MELNYKQLKLLASHEFATKNNWNWKYVAPILIFGLLSLTSFFFISGSSLGKDAVLRAEYRLPEVIESDLLIVNYNNSITFYEIDGKILEIVSETKVEPKLKIIATIFCVSLFGFVVTFLWYFYNRDKYVDNYLNKFIKKEEKNE